MNLLLAQVPATASEIYNSLGALALVLAVVEKLVNIFTKKKTSVEGAVQVQGTKEYVEKRTCEHLGELNREEHAELQKKISEEIRRLWETSNAQGREISGVAATLDVNGQRLVQMDGKIDTLLRRHAS